MSYWMHVEGIISISESRTLKYRIEDKVPEKGFFENIKYEILKALGGVCEDNITYYKRSVERDKVENNWSNPESNMMNEMCKFALKHPDLIRKHDKNLDGSEGGIFYKVIPMRPAQYFSNIKVLVDGSLRDRGQNEDDVLKFFEAFSKNISNIENLDKIWVSDVNIVITTYKDKYLIQKEFDEKDDSELLTLFKIDSCEKVSVYKL